MTCAICIESIKPFELFETDCCHQQFHWYCCMRWILINHTCPLCRKVLDLSSWKKSKSLSEAIYMHSTSGKKKYHKDLKWWLINASINNNYWSASVLRDKYIEQSLHGDTQLHVACEWGNHHAIYYMLQLFDCVPEMAKMKNNKGQTPLDLAKKFNIGKRSEWIIEQLQRLDT